MNLKNGVNDGGLFDNPVIMMTVTNILISTFARTIDNFLQFFGSIFKLLFLKCYYKWFYVFNKREVKFHIPLTNMSEQRSKMSGTVFVNSILNSDGEAIMWYLNNFYSDTLTCVKNEDIDKIPCNYTKVKEINKFYVPTIDSSNEVSFGWSLENPDVSQYDYGNKIGERKNVAAENKKNAYSEKQKINDDISFTFHYTKTENDRYHQANTTQPCLFIIFYSTTLTIEKLHNFYNTIITKHTEHIKMSNRKKMFIYKYVDARNIYNYSVFDIDEHQSGEHIFMQHKKEIDEDIEFFNNVSYHKKFGIKRKLSYYFVGPVGCGKNTLASYLADKMGRMLVTIPPLQLKSNSDLQKILYERMINGKKYNMEDIVFFFDQIDSSKNVFNCENNTKQKNESEQLSKNSELTEDSEQQNKLKIPNVDKIDLGTVLNLLDGNIDQDGMCIIFAGNTVESVNSAIYRDGRAKLIKIDYVGQNEISDMIERYNDIKLTQEQKDRLPSEKTVQSLTVKKIVIKLALEKIRLEKDIIVNSDYTDTMIDKFNELYDIEENIMKTMDIDNKSECSCSDSDSGSDSDSDSNSDSDSDSDSNSNED